MNLHVVPLPVTEINWGSDILMAWLSNYIDIKLWDVIALSLMVVHQRWCKAMDAYKSNGSNHLFKENSL